MKRKKRICAGLTAACVFACGVNAYGAAPKNTEPLYTIGVAMYSSDSPEMNMFRGYYKDYLEQGFPVRFYFSNSISSAEEEQAFIRTVKEKGAQGIISFYGTDVQSTVQVCQEEEMYYVLGSGTISDEDFAAVEENPWFLGTVGPDPQAEYQAGADMAEYFVEEGKKSFLVLTGGSELGNFMHQSRVQGITDTLEEAGISKEEITFSSGYMTTEEGVENFEQALSQGTYDAVLSSYNADEIWEQIKAKEEEQGSDIQVGAVDCFSQENLDAFQTKDAFGNSMLNFIEGKYASMAGPAFAILYNAMAGDLDANTEDGKAVRLYQGFWKAESEEEYMQLYAYTQDIYENAYSCDDLMEVIKSFSQDAAPEKLKALTEAYTVEDVKNRILG